MRLQDELFGAGELESCAEARAAELGRAAEQERAAFYARCDLPRYPEPRGDNQRLLELQARWLKDGDDAARRELFTLGYEVIRRIIRHELKAGRRPFLDREAQDEAAADAFEYVFRRYTRGAGYAVRSNFISALKDGVRHALDYTTMADRTLPMPEDEGRIVRRL